MRMPAVVPFLLFVFVLAAGCGDPGEGQQRNMEPDPNPTERPGSDPGSDPIDPEPGSDPEPYVWPEDVLIPHAGESCPEYSVVETASFTLPTWDQIKSGEDIPDLTIVPWADETITRYDFTARPELEVVPEADSPWLDVPEANQGPCFNPDFHDRVPDKIEVCLRQVIEGGVVVATDPACLLLVPENFEINADESITVQWTAAYRELPEGADGHAFTQVRMEWHSYGE